MKHPFAKDRQSDLDNGLDAGSYFSPMIHESVFRRIAAGVDGYAPIVIPAAYRVTTKNGQILPRWHESDSQAEARARRQERVWNWVWCRRVVYFVTLLVSLALAATPLLLLKWPGNGEASWAAFLIPAIDVAGRFLPSFAAYWIDAFKQAPTWLLAGGGVLAVLLYVAGILRLRIRDKMRLLWRETVSGPPHPHDVAPCLPPSDKLYVIRSSMVYRGFFHTLTYWVLPGVCAAVIVYGLSAGTSRVLFSVGDSLGFVCAGSSAPFATKTLCHPAVVTVTKDRTYLITLTLDKPWQNSFAKETRSGTGLNGFAQTEMTGNAFWEALFFLPMRRLVMENWFQIVVRVGSTGQEEQMLHVEPDKTVKADKPGPGAAATAPAVFTGTFKANHSGQLFLFVNDAEFGLPGNNTGTATVKITPDP